MELFELARTFNCGIGLIIYVDAGKADAVLDALRAGPEPEALIIGSLVTRDGGDAVILENSEHWRGQA
jgi:phosphoribosylformylglycinamidine cyclo-ligase